jgi:hypothetical protein
MKLHDSLLFILTEIRGMLKAPTTVTAREILQGTHYIGGWLSLREVLDVTAYQKSGTLKSEIARRPAGSYKYLMEIFRSSSRVK